MEGKLMKEKPISYLMGLLEKKFSHRFLGIDLFSNEEGQKHVRIKFDESKETMKLVEEWAKYLNVCIDFVNEGVPSDGLSLVYFLDSLHEKRIKLLLTMAKSCSVLTDFSLLNPSPGSLPFVFNTFSDVLGLFTSESPYCYVDVKSQTIAFLISTLLNKKYFDNVYYLCYLDRYQMHFGTTQTLEFADWKPEEWIDGLGWFSPVDPVESSIEDNYPMILEEVLDQFEQREAAKNENSVDDQTLLEKTLDQFEKNDKKNEKINKNKGDETLQAKSENKGKGEDCSGLRFFSLKKQQQQQQEDILFAVLDKFNPEIQHS